MDRAPRRSAQYRPTHEAQRRMGNIGLAVGGGLALTILLTICVIATLVPALNRVVGAVLSNATAASGASTSATPSGVATQAPTATAAPHADWATFTSGGGFRIDIPNILGSSH